MKVPTNYNRIQLLAAAALLTFAMAMAWSARSFARPIDDPALPAATGDSASSQPGPYRGVHPGLSDFVGSPNAILGSRGQPSDQASPNKPVGSRPVASSDSQSVAAPSSGFAWGDAGIGAAFALTMIGIGGLLVLSNRRHRHGRAATTA